MAKFLGERWNSRAVLVLALGLVSQAAFALPDVDQPVMVGGIAELDACGGSGITTVSTLVYSKSAQGYAKWDLIQAGTAVIFCDEQESQADGVQYTGVVIPNEVQNCGVSSPIADRKAYDGPCQSGWIKSSDLELLAGKLKKPTL